MTETTTAFWYPLWTFVEGVTALIPPLQNEVTVFVEFTIPWEFTVDPGFKQFDTDFELLNIRSNVCRVVIVLNQLGTQLEPKLLHVCVQEFPLTPKIQFIEVGNAVGIDVGEADKLGVIGNIFGIAVGADVGAHVRLDVG